MKRLVWLIFCLMTMASADAQWYRSGSRAGNRMANYAHSMKLTSMRLNNNHYRYKSYPSDDFHFEKTIIGGIGIGKSYCDEGFENSFDIDCIIFNALVTIKVGDKKDNTDYNIPVSAQIGYYIPILNFGGKDFSGREHNTKIFISPLIGIGYTEFGGALMVKHQFLYMAGKITDKGLGFSVGLSY